MNKRQYKKWDKKQSFDARWLIGCRNAGTSLVRASKAFEKLTKVAVRVVDETLGLKGVVLVDSRDDEE